MALEIQNATPTMEQDWRRLWRAYLNFYHAERDETSYASAWARIMDPSEKMHSVLAFVDGTAVGLSNFLYHDSFWEPEQRCYLNDLYVDPDARGHGAGEALIGATVAHAKDAGAAQVYWTTARDNTAARGLYDKVANLTPFIKYQA